MSKINVTVPAVRDAFEQTVVQYDSDTGRVYLDDTFIGTISKGSNTVRVGGNARRGSAHYFAGVTAWQAWLPEHAPHSHRHDFDGDHYPAHYKRNSRRGAIAFLLTAHLGEKADAYFSWA